MTCLSCIKKVLVCFILLLLLNSKIGAQPYYFRHYQVEDGLSNNTVFCSIQDKNGFLWFGTKDGLNRFDGYHFKLYNLEKKDNKKTITADRIYCLFTDKNGVLYVGAEKGLYLYNAGKEHLTRLTDSLNNVNAIKMDRSGQLWFIAGNVVCRYNFKTKNVTKFTPSKYFYATSLCEDEQGSIWFSTDNGYIQKFNEATGAFTRYDVFEHSKLPTSRWIQKIHTGNNGSLFIGTTNQGLKQFDIKTATYKDVLTYNPDRTTIFVRDILQYSAGEYWFATESGIFILDVNTGRFVNLKKKFIDPYSISDNAVYTLCKDAEGGIWAGTYFGGVNYYSKQYSAFQKYYPDNTENAIIGNAVREICEDHYKNLWIGTEDAGLCKLDKKTGEITHFKPTGESTSISYSNIHGLMINGDDLWIGTFEHGIDIMNVKTGLVKKHYTAGTGKNDLKSNFALCFLHHSNGEIYVGTSNGFYHYSSNKNNFERQPELNEIIFVSSIIEDHDKNIWVATNNNGVYWFNTASGKVVHFKNDPSNGNSLTNNSINAVFEDSNNNIWLATEGGGVCKVGGDRKTVTRFTTKNGFPSNFIFKVLEDNNKYLWVTTSKGLVKFNPVSLSTIVYTKANGLLNDQFNYHSGYKDDEGKLYFGSVKGMISFNPGNIIDDSIQVPVFITGLQVHNKDVTIGEDSSLLNKSINYTRKITLNYYQSSVSIDFAALSFISPGMTEYAYKLEGLDNDWTYLKPNRKVYFTNLSPGTYTFKVKAAKNRIWLNNEKQLVITILPPFWATRLAYLIYITLFIIIVYYLVNNYHKRHQAKKEKEIYEAKIDFFTNVAHEIKTPLTLIKGPVENLMERLDEHPLMKEDVTTLDRNTNRLINLISQILDFRQTEIKSFSLDFEEVDITKLLTETFENFKTLARKKNLKYEIELPHTSVTVLADEDALLKIFSNLFSNAVKYAEKKVKVKMLISEQHQKDIIIEIENDGYIIPFSMREKIFEPFYRLKQTAKQKGTGIGLTLARSLTELHKGSLFVKDSKSDSNIFVFKLPATSKHIKDQDKYIKKKPLNY